MKKLLRNILVYVLAVLLVLPMAACGTSEFIDTTKTQLRVYNYNGGIGSVWLDEVMERFAEDYADVCFEPGTDKKGVQFLPEKAKTAELQTVANSANVVIFCEIANYPSLVSNRRLLPINDVVTTPLNQLAKTDDTSTIQSKMSKQMQDYLSYSNDTYYALPHYAVFSCVTYNRQLFEDKLLYFAEDPTGTTLDDQFIHGKFETRSCGPDGVKGNEDDGLPATYDEFFLLCQYMEKKTVIPFIWSGSGKSGYMNYLINSIYLNLAGAKQARYNYSYDSGTDTITIIENFDAQGNPTTKEEKVSPSNWEVLNSELEKYQAIAIADKIIDSENWQHASCMDSTSDMLSAQKNFIFSYNEGTPIGMIVEGSYWYNEADVAGHFDDAELNFGEEYAKKNDYAILPLPRVYSGRASDIEGTSIHKCVVSDQNDTVGCINANAAGNTNIVNLAKTFLAYCYTQESLAEFNEITRITRSLDYTVNEENLDAWGKVVWNHTQNSDLVLPYSDSNVYLENRAKFSMHISNNFWNVGGQTAYNGLKGTSTAKNAVEYFKRFIAQ